MIDLPKHDDRPDTKKPETYLPRVEAPAHDARPFLVKEEPEAEPVEALSYRSPPIRSQGVPFSAEAVADGWWEVYHDDDCGGVITPYPENLCLKCGMHPDLQSRGARRTSKTAEGQTDEPA